MSDSFVQGVGNSVKINGVTKTLPVGSTEFRKGDFVTLLRAGTLTNSDTFINTTNPYYQSCTVVSFSDTIKILLFGSINAGNSYMSYRVYDYQGSSISLITSGTISGPSGVYPVGGITVEENVVLVFAGARSTNNAKAYIIKWNGSSVTYTQLSNPAGSSIVQAYTVSDDGYVWCVGGTQTDSEWYYGYNVLSRFKVNTQTNSFDEHITVQLPYAGSDRRDWSCIGIVLLSNTQAYIVYKDNQSTSGIKATCSSSGFTLGTKFVIGSKNTYGYGALSVISSTEVLFFIPYANSTDNWKVLVINVDSNTFSSYEVPPAGYTTVSHITCVKAKYNERYEFLTDQQSLRFLILTRASSGAFSVAESPFSELVTSGSYSILEPDTYAIIQNIGSGSNLVYTVSIIDNKESVVKASTSATGVALQDGILGGTAKCILIE